MVRLALLLTVLVTSTTAQGQTRAFEQGRISASALLGSASYSTGRYIIAGAGVGVFVLDGLEVSVDVEHWFGSEAAAITKLSPGVRYIVYQVPTFHPYAGVFYRHWFVHDGFADADTVGSRFGAIYAMDHILLGLGAMYELVLSDCEVDCGAWSPELSLGIVF